MTVQNFCLGPFGLAGRFAIGGEMVKSHTGFVIKVALYAAFVAFTLADVLGRGSQNGA
jgi:hypothetical protein